MIKAEPRASGPLSIHLDKEAQGTVFFSGVNISPYVTRLKIDVDPKRPKGPIRAMITLYMEDVAVYGLLEHVTADSEIVELDDLIEGDERN